MGERVVRFLCRRQMRHGRDLTNTIREQGVANASVPLGCKPQPMHAGIDLDPRLRQIGPQRLAPLELLIAVYDRPQV